MNPDAIAGVWKLPHSSVVISISTLGGELQIRAKDSDDGEELAVEDVQVEANAVVFTLVTPSTQWTVHKSIEPQDNGSLRCVTTRIDTWERIA